MSLPVWKEKFYGENGVSSISDPLQGLSSLEYYGQRPWRPGKLSAEPPDMKKEKDGIQALQYLEKTRVKHSVIILALLSDAIGQFNTYRFVSCLCLSNRTDKYFTL